MSIIKDQLFDAQLEVIDNGSLPAGKPVGSVFYNKTIEAIQTAKVDTNLKTVAYLEDFPNHEIQYMVKELFFDQALTPAFIKIFEVDIIANRDYKIHSQMSVDSNFASSDFSFSINHSTISASALPIRSSDFINILGNADNKAVSSHAIFNSGINTKLVLWASGPIGVNTFLRGSKVEGGVTTFPTRLTVEQLPFHNSVGAFT